MLWDATSVSSTTYRIARRHQPDAQRERAAGTPQALRQSRTRRPDPCRRPTPQNLCPYAALAHLGTPARLRDGLASCALDSSWPSPPVINYQQVSHSKDDRWNTSVDVSYSAGELVLVR